MKIEIPAEWNASIQDANRANLPGEISAEIQENLKKQNAAEIQAEIDNQRKVNFKSSRTVAAGFEPARYGEALQLERKTGVPAKTAYDNWGQVERIKQEEKMAGLFTTTPRTADALSNPQHAIIAKGDEENLQYMERAVQQYEVEKAGFWAMTFGKWSDRKDVSNNVGRQAQLERITTDFDRVDAGDDFSSPWANEYRAADEAGRKVMRDNLQLQQNLSTEKARTAQFELSKLPTDPGDVAFEKAEGVAGVASTIVENPMWAARKAGESLPDMAQGLALGLINPIFGSVSEGTTAANYKLIEVLQEKGIDPSDPIQLMKALRDDDLMNEANARAARYGAGIGAVSLLSFGLLGKVMAPTAIGGKALTAGQRELISAGVQMPVQGALEAAGEATGQLAERGRTSDLDSKEIALEGFLGTLMAVPEAGGFAGKRFMQHMAQARRTERAATLQTDLVGKSLESSTRKNDPATFDAIVGAQLAGKPNEWLEIPAAKLQELNQSGQVNVPELLEQINVDPNHYAAQVELGGTVRMKNSSYLAYLAEYDEQLSSSVRFATNDMNLEEVQAIDKQMLADMEQVAQNFGKTDQVAAAYSDAMGQLLGAGYERSAADTTARQYAAVMTRLAEQTSQTVEDVMAANPLNIGRDLPPAVRRIKGDEISLMLGRLRAGDVPRPADMFGKSLTEYLTAAGGLDDTGGELAAFDADVGKVGRNRLARAGGKSLDDAAMAAWERGYFPGMAREDVTPNMLIDALREEAAGTPRFSVEQENATLRDQAANLEALQEFLDREGVDLATVTDDEIRALLSGERQGDGQVLNQSQRFSEDNRLSNLSMTGPSWERIRAANPALAKVKSPDDQVTIYRATVGDQIRPDDFVAVSRDVAEMELENVRDRDGAGEIIEQRVPVRDLLMGNDATEFVYFPEQSTLNQSALTPDQRRLVDMTEDEYIAAVNPENKRSDEADIVIVRTGDLDMPRDARPAAGFKDKTGADVQIFVDGNGSIYAQQDGEVIGQIENRDGETLNIVTVEAQGKGIGQGLAAELIRRDPFAPAGSFSPAGEATRRAAFRTVQAELSTFDQDIEALAEFYASDEDYQFDSFERREAIIDRLVNRAVADADLGGLQQPTSYGSVMVTPSAKEAGKWQVTQFAADGTPNSDGGIQTKAQAMRDFFDEIRPVSRQLNQSPVTTAPADAETGKPMTVYFARNTVSSKGNAPAGMDFGQKIEPAGEYMVIQEGDMSSQGGNGWVYGSITFSNPLVLEHKDTTSSGWKKDLSEMFGGKTGKALTKAVQKAGHDAIVTRDKYGYSETVNLSGIKAEQRTTLNQDATDYRDEHTAPGREDAAPLSDLTGDGTIYPDDIYSSNGPRYYGTGVPYDKKAFQLASKVRGNPDAMVTIYRAVPSGVTTTINPGDWVAITREYADAHGESRFDGDYDVIEMQVRAGDIFTNGDSIQEWGYDPESTTLAQSETKQQLVTRLQEASPGLKLDLLGSGDRLTLSRIELPKEGRQQGTGTKIMDEITAWADANGKALALTPSSDFGGNKARLVKFYKRFGFVENKGKNRDFEISEAMFRVPSTTLNQSQPGAAQTETEAFKSWFGDSKVVDADGKPLVVYHGTASDISVFDISRSGESTNNTGFYGQGAYFTEDIEDATGYAAWAERGEGGRNLIPAYLSIRNPVYVHVNPKTEADKSRSRRSLQVLLDQLEKNGVFGTYPDPNEAGSLFGKLTKLLANAEFEKFMGTMYNSQGGGQAVTEIAQKAGFDGVAVYSFKRDRNMLIEAVAFKPEQIKSAIGNRGTFDPSSPNILEQSGEEDARGSITFGGRRDGVRRFDIKLGKKSDLSTVLHEMGHYYLEVIGDLVADGKANESLAADYGVIRDWLGADAGKPLTVDQHEQFARGFEKYLATGKAPSIELQDAFARFKRWLVGVYKDLARLNVEISPEVRGVFDRLLASEQAITEAEQALAMTEQYEARITELMSEDEKANYLRASRQARDDATSEIEQEILKAEKQKEQRWYNEQRRKVEAEVRDELEASQAYQARKYLFGNTPHPDIGRALRLDTAAVTELFGTKSKEARFLGRARARENGVHPEIAASILGYPNPVEMLTDMRAVPRLAEAVKLETERRMAERYPDPRKDGTLADKAMAAVGEREAEVQAIQLRTLARQAGRAPSQHKIIKEAARRHIASLKLRDVIPHAFRRASEKAARAVEDALIKGDMPKAYEEKEKQLMNLHLFREAVKAQDLSIQKRAQAKEYTKAGAKRKRLQDASVENYELAYPDGRIEYAATKTAAKQAEAEGATVTPLFNFLEQVDAILTRYEFSIPRRAIRQQREALVEFLASMSGDHIVVNPPEWILLDRSQRTNWSELTIDELIDAVDMIRQIDQMAKNKLQVLKAGRWEEFEPIRDAIVNSIELNASAARSSQFNKSFADDIRRWGREWLGLLPVDQIARELDGQDELGPVQENITTPVQVAARKAVIREKAEHQALAELIKQFYSDDQIKGMAEKRIAVAEINDSLTKMQMIMLMANLGNEGNRKALLSEQRGIWSAETIQSVMSRLDSNDADFVEALWAWVDKFWPEVSENEARRTGVTPAKVENDPYPVKLADGKVRVLKGGYFPLKYDGDMSIKTSQDDVANAFKNMTAGRTAKAYTPEGHRIERVGSGGRPVKLDLSVVLGHVNEVVRDIVMTDPVNQSWRYLHDGEIQGAFERSNLKEIFTALEIWLQDTAEGEKVDSGYMTASARWLRTGFTANVMLFNLANSALNLAGTHPLVVLGKRWALNGYRNAMKPANWQQMYELSEYMREARVDSYSKDLQLVQDHMRNKGGWRDVMTQAGFYLHNKTQMFMDAVTWMGAYEKGMSMDLVGQDLITYADQRVVEASGSGVFADRSAMERGTITRQTRQNELVRGLTTLAGYMIRKMAIARRRTGETNFKDIGQAVNWAVDMALLFTVEGLMFALAKGNVPDEEDEGQAAGWAKSAAWETFASVGSGLPPFGRPIVAGLQGFGGGSSSIDIFAEQFGNALTQAKQGDADVTAAKALIAMVGTATKTPGIATNRVIDWLDRAQDGETPPWYELLTGNRDK